MALVKEAVRVGLLQKVSRYVSPPNPSSSSSFLWRADSFSKQRRDIMLSRMMEFRTSFFSSTTTASVSVQEEHAVPMATVEEEETSEATSSDTNDSSSVLDRTYGEEQADPHKVAEDSHAHFIDTKDDDEPDTLESTGFDISKATRPSGAE